MNARLLAAAVAVAGFLAESPRAAADYIFDDFNTPAYDYQISRPNSSPYTTTDKVNTGLNRQIRVTVTTPVPPNFNSASGFIGGGRFSMDTDNETRANAEIKYTPSSGFINLSNASGLALNFTALNPGNITNPTPAAVDMPVTITVATATGTRTLTTNISGSTTFSLSSFKGPGDLSQVTAITFLLNGGSNSRLATDFALDSITVASVPAPPAVLLAGIGVLALAGRARLTRRAATIA